jgi:hypothetical protein
MDKIFEPNSIDTTICNSTLHELWSYGNQEETVRTYLQNKFEQTRVGGRLVIRDVVGPENKDQEVYMLCNKTDGSNENIEMKINDTKKLAAHLKGLSTYAKFVRFSQDYLADMRESGKRGTETQVKYRIENIDGNEYIVLKLKDAVEFMTKKDYVDNWNSELNEEFAFWSFSEWKDALTTAGFKIIEDPNQADKISRVYTSEWIAKNSFKEKVELYTKTEKGLQRMDYPVTNMVLAGEKVDPIYNNDHI